MTQSHSAANFGAFRLFDTIYRFFYKIKKDLAMQAEINRTIKELSQLSDAELRDIGLTRGNIYSVAHEVYYDNISTDTNRNLRGWV